MYKRYILTKLFNMSQSFECFSNFIMHMNHLEICSNVDSESEVRDGWNFTFLQASGDASAAGLWTTL